MKKYALIGLLLCMLSPMLFCGNRPTSKHPGSIKVLAIGNSFSADAVEQELYGLLVAAGYDDIIIGNMYIGGEMNHPDKISDNLARVCQEAAHRAVTNPFHVSDMSDLK